MNQLATWVSHFGLTRTPFSKSIPAHQLFTRTAHQEAIARIHFCVQESALGVFVGEVGAGKTVAVRAALPAFAGTRGLYYTIVSSLGSSPRFHKAEILAQVQHLLAAEEAERHRRVVLVIDEAHLLSPDQLEQLRLLTNVEMDSKSPASWSVSPPWPGSSGSGCTPLMSPSRLCCARFPLLVGRGGGRSKLGDIITAPAGRRGPRRSDDIDPPGPSPVRSARGRVP